MMRLGLSMWSYVRAFKDGRMDVIGFINECQRLHVDGVELLDFFWRDSGQEVPKAIARLDDVGLPCAVYSIGNDFVQPDASARASEVEKVRRELMIAKQLRAPVVRVFAGDLHEGVAFDEALGWIVEGLSECARSAHSQGLRLALENHGLLAGRSDQVRTIIELVRSQVGNDALGANPDTGNFMLVRQDSVEAVRELAPYAYMVHFKDFRALPDEYTGPCYQSAQGNKFGGTAIGEGEVDLAACVEALRAAGFDGFLNIEYEAEEDPYSGVERSVANARRLVPSI
jgi:sugar phosphate isomerase/epimerase